MAFWQKKTDEFETMHQVIQANPGITPAELARRLQVERSTVLRRLPSLDEAGFFCYEDDGGRLWAFGPHSDP